VQVLRALRLGDLLVAVPAFRAMRRAWPAARIELIGLPWARALIQRLPGYLDELVEFPGWPGVRERDVDPHRITSFLAAAQADPADLAIQLHGSGVVTNGFVAMLGARRTAGQALPGMFAPDPELFVTYVHGSEVRRNLAVLERLGVDPAGEDLELLVLDEDRRAVAEGPAGDLPPEGYAVLHPGSSTPAKRWPPEGFAAVADALAEHLPVVVTGSRGERAATAATIAAMRRPAIDLTGCTTLGALVALVADARIVVANDTGVAHVADAVRTPSVVVFTSSDPARWGPLDRELHRVVAAPSIERDPVLDGADGATPCRPDGCLHAAPEPTRPAPDGVSVEAVRSEALDLLSIGVLGAA
jgi:ADP-heptose:LPS heptosyltransferase